MPDLIDRLRAVWGHHAGLATDGDEAHQRMADAINDAIITLFSREQSALRARMTDGERRVVELLDGVADGGWETCDGEPIHAEDARRIIRRIEDSFGASEEER